MPSTSVMIPVTLDAALNEPMSSGRSACATSSASRRAASMWPSASSGIVTTSAIDSRQGSSLLWCSYGPMNTTGRCSRGICAVKPWARSRSAGIRRLRMPTSLSIAPVVPEPVKMTTASSPQLSESATIARASSRSRVVCRPVPLLSVCVFA